MFRVLSCVIYTIVRKYVCIDCLGSEKSKLSSLRLGGTGRYKHYDTDYENVLVIGIPYLLLNFFIVTAFQRTINMLSYSNFLIGCLNTILINDSLFLNVMKKI